MLGDEDGPSVKNVLTNMSTMLMALTSKVDRIDPAAGCPGRAVRFQDVQTAPPDPSTSQERVEPVPVETLPPIVEVSEEVRSKVAQRRTGASAPFLLMGEDSRSDEEGAASRKRLM